MSVSARTEGIDHKHSTASLLQQEIKVQLHLILDLAETLRKDEIVPHSIGTSLFSSQSPSTSAASTRRTSETRTSRDEQPYPHQDNHTVQPRLASMPSVQNMLSPSEVSSRRDSHAENSPDGPASRAMSRAGSEAGPSQVPASPRSPSFRSEDDFIDIRSGEGLKVVTSPGERVEQGHIRYQEGDKKPATAIIQPEQAFNFMTTFRASKLDLLHFLEPYEDDKEETWIMLPSGERIRPLGTIQLRWYPSHTRSVTLKFFVLPRWEEPKIVLGAPFVAKRGALRKAKEG